MERENRVTLGHGAGGSLTKNLISSLFVPHIRNDLLLAMGDSAILREGTPENRFAFTTDSYVVTPLFFPGGDIGKLAVNGTINDLVVAGANPLYLSAGFILEEGLLFDDLKKIIESISDACRLGNVEIVAADTKVVNKGKGDGLFINTSGVGSLLPRANLNPKRIEPGDKIMVTGTLGDHGISVFLARQNLGIDTDVKSDCAALTSLLLPLIDKFGEDIHFMRDLTRGGFATILNEVALQSFTNIAIHEDSIPVLPGVTAICEMLGFDPIYLANEGKTTIILSTDVAEEALKLLKSHELGRNAAIVGTVEKSEDKQSRVFMTTSVGGTRIVDSLLEDQLPRIC